MNFTIDVSYNDIEDGIAQLRHIIAGFDIDVFVDPVGFDGLEVCLVVYFIVLFVRHGPGDGEVYVQVNAEAELIGGECRSTYDQALFFLVNHVLHAFVDGVVIGFDVHEAQVREPKTFRDILGDRLQLGDEPRKQHDVVLMLDKQGVYNVHIFKILR